MWVPKQPMHPTLTLRISMLMCFLLQKKHNLSPTFFMEWGKVIIDNLLTGPIKSETCHTVLDDNWIPYDSLHDAHADGGSHPHSQGHRELLCQHW